MEGLRILPLSKIQRLEFEINRNTVMLQCSMFTHIGNLKRQKKKEPTRSGQQCWKLRTPRNEEIRWLDRFEGQDRGLATVAGENQFRFCSISYQLDELVSARRTIFDMPFPIETQDGPYLFKSSKPVLVRYIFVSDTCILGPYL